MYNADSSGREASAPASRAATSGSPPRRVTAPALRRGLDILELFLEPNDGLRIPEITERLGVPRASVHELVGVLVERGYLRAVSETPSRFALGVKSFELGGAYERVLDLAEFGRSAARSVAEQCGETVQIVVLDEKFVVYVVRIDSRHSVRLVSDVGRRLPAHCTAGGKALLSQLTSREFSNLYPDDASLQRMTERSISTLARLNDELDVSRARGWAAEYCESNVDVACVAAPVYDARGQCVAAMSISVPTGRWDEDKKDHYVELVSSGARELSESLGAHRSA